MPSYCYEFPRPAVTTDVAAFNFADGTAKILLIQRLNPPFQGHWALPGGFINPNEDLPTCARREFAEETGLETSQLRLVNAYSEPNRDPRGRTITFAYATVIDPERADATGSDPVAKDDAADARWFDLFDLPDLAFDHDIIVRDAAKAARQAVEQNDASSANSISLLTALRDFAAAGNKS